MPQVASALKTLAPDRSLAARPAPTPRADRIATAPFASLLDDSAPAADRSPPPAQDNNAAPTVRSDSAQPSAKTDDSKVAKSKNDASSTDAGKDSKVDKTAGDGTVTADAKIDPKADPKADPKTDPKADAKTATPTDGKDGKPVNDGKVSDGQATDGLVTAATPLTDPAPATTVVDATITAPAPVPAPVPAVALPTAPATDNTVTNTVTNTATVAMPAKADARAALQAGKAKAADNSALTAKAAAQPHDEAKPQGPASDADKDAIAHARGELADSGHHAAVPQAQAALAADANAAAPKAAGADAAQPTALTAPSQTTAPAGPNPAATAPAPPPAAIPLAGVAIEIASKALAGKNHFEIRLDPPELGRIEVRLDVDRDGNVTSRLIADRADTLDLLRRDASGLERALQDAGLKTSDNGLQFSLRDQSAQQQQGNSGGADIARLVVEDEMLPTIDAPQRSYSRLAGLGGGVDIQV